MPNIDAMMQHRVRIYLTTMAVIRKRLTDDTHYNGYHTDGVACITLRPGQGDVMHLALDPAEIEQSLNLIDMFLGHNLHGDYGYIKPVTMLLLLRMLAAAAGIDNLERVAFDEKHSRLHGKESCWV